MAIGSTMGWELVGKWAFDTYGGIFKGFTHKMDDMDWRGGLKDEQFE